MFKLPSKVQIGPVTYDVKVEARTSENGCYAQIIHGESVITMMPGLSIDMQESTFLHEVLHGIWFQGGVKEHDEQLVDITAHGLVMLKRQNPKLFD